MKLGNNDEYHMTTFLSPDPYGSHMSGMFLRRFYTNEPADTYDNHALFVPPPSSTLGFNPSNESYAWINATELVADFLEGLSQHINFFFGEY